MVGLFGKTFNYSYSYYYRIMVKYGKVNYICSYIPVYLYIAIQLYSYNNYYTFLQQVASWYHQYLLQQQRIVTGEAILVQTPLQFEPHHLSLFHLVMIP